MSPEDFERRLRDARGTLPEPDASTTERARAQALRAVRRRRPRARIAALVGVALAVALAAGAGIGTLVAPDVTASRGPVGIGFLPQPGWYVLQSSTRQQATDPVVTVASNVAFDADDDIRGLSESSALPYETLLALPPNGVVLVALFLPNGPVTAYGTADYKPTELPLRLSSAVPSALYGAQVRPEAPLGHYRLRAALDDYNVEVAAYFGREQPTRAQFRAAQRQLAGLVVRSAKSTREPSAAVAPRASEATVVDRTFSCAVLQNGGIYEVEARGQSGIREGGKRWKTLAFAVAATGSTGSAETQLDNSLAWITAGAPSPTTKIEEGGYFPTTVASVGTVAVSLRQCKATKARVPLSPAGLQGGVAGQLGEVFDCESPRRVLIHVRARLTTGTLKQSRGFLRASAPVTQASLAMRTVKGKPLMYATVSESGAAKLFTAKSCLPD